MRSGFKTEAERKARAVRHGMSLAPTSRLDAWRLAEHLAIPVIPMSSFILEEPDAVRFFQKEGREMFSAVTVFRESRGMIVFNDSHAPVCQVSNIVHELAHGLLLHPRTTALDERGCRQWDREIEEEADLLSGAILVPAEAALLITERGWSPAKAAAKYGVSRAMIEFRLIVTGARKPVQRIRVKWFPNGLPDGHPI